MAATVSSRAACPPHQLSSPVVAAAFEMPPEAFVKPFEALSPIMARLPRGEDEPAVSSKDAVTSPGYLSPTPGAPIAGALPYSPSHRGITYTVSRLPDADEGSRELWKALHHFRPLTTDYAGDFQAPPSRKQRRAAAVVAAAAAAATVSAQQHLSAPHPITPGASVADCPFVASSSESARGALDLVRQAFNWPAIRLPAGVDRSFYGVVFRSKRAAGSESTDLYDADRLAHEEAVASGGLLMYFYGAPDPVTGTNLATCIWSSREEALAASSLPLHAKAAAHARKAYESFELSRYLVTKVAGEVTLRIEEWDGEE